jgi:hypothetical protein
MPRSRTRKTRKFALSVKGLTDEQAAQAHYLLANCADAFTYGDSDRCDTASNVWLKVLRAEYPDSPWVSATKKDRIDIIS